MPRSGGSRSRRGALAAGLMGLWMLACGPASGAPWTPANDNEIVETLPTVTGWSAQERRLRRDLLQRPRDESAALAAAQGYLELARSQGDARYAGYALGALQAWQPLSATTPPTILVMHATVTQFLHDFDGAENTLQLALAANPADAQAWLTLATIRRVRGRYADSDTACRALTRLRQNLYAVACLAENAGLRGQHQEAQRALQGLLEHPSLQQPGGASTRQWLLTTVAEINELAGDDKAAESAYRQALAAQRDGYDVLAYSDFLLRKQRPTGVPLLLKTEARSDAVLLRRVIAARQLLAAASVSVPTAQREAAQRDADELTARFEAAALRPGTASVHAREYALFALDVQHDAARALTLARLNVQLQREPIDLLIFARAAVAARDDVARREVRALMLQIGLHDARVDAALI